MNIKTIELLKNIKNNNFEFDNINKYDLVLELFEYIGHPTSEIRDDLIYECLAHLFHDHHFDELTLTTFLNILLDDKHLQHDLDNKIKYSVLTRSFTILQLVIFIFIHNRDGIIKRDDIVKTFNIFIDYFNQENMLDGYNKEVGWIHAIAHSADLFNQFMKVSWFKNEELEIMFEEIATKMKQDKHLFTFNEEERMVVAIKTGIKRNILKKDYVMNWIDRFASYDKLKDLPNQVYLKNNIKHFLRALYFALIDEEDDQYIVKHIKYKLLAL
jgi:hypothetical protein